MSLLLRDAAETDIPLILQFIRGLAVYEQLLHEVVATEEGLKKSLFGEPRTAFVTIAEWEGKPVGFALYFYNYSTFLGQRGIYIEDLYVLPECRGKGIGRALLAHLAKKAVDEGCGRLEWWVLDWNEPSIGFYKALGAKPMDEWTVFRLTGPALNRLAGQKSHENA